MEQSREEFEVWVTRALEEVYDGGFMSRHPNYFRLDEFGNYVHMKLNMQYETFLAGWQASRAAVVVEVPAYQDDVDYDQAILSCRQAIKAQGLTVKP